MKGSLEQTGMLAFPDEEDGPKSFAEQRTRNRAEGSMSDRLLSGRGQYLSKAAKVGYKSFTCVVLKVQTFFLYKQLFILDRGLVQW